MPFHIERIAGTFYRPGERKNNASIVWRGRVPGRSGVVEIVTNALAESAAARHVRNFLDAQARSTPPAPGATVKLSVVAQHYKTTKNPGKADLDRIEFILSLHGDKEARELSQAHVNEACATFRARRAEARRQAERDLAAWRAMPEKPRRPDGHLLAAPRIPTPPSTATVNREVTTPYRALLKFAANQKWAWEITIYAQKPPATEAPGTPVRTAWSDDVARLLQTPAIAKFPNRYAFVLVTDERGLRIRDTLRMRWEWQDLARGLGRTLIKKPKPRWFTFELSPAAVAALASMGPRESGLVFSWGSPSNVYDWLNVAEKECGIKWRPHESRRAVVTAIIQNTGDVKLAQKYVDHLSPNTTLRYRQLIPSELAPATRRKKR